MLDMEYFNLFGEIETSNLYGASAGGGKSETLVWKFLNQYFKPTKTLKTKVKCGYGKGGIRYQKIKTGV